MDLPITVLYVMSSRESTSRINPSGQSLIDFSELRWNSPTSLSTFKQRHFYRYFWSDYPISLQQRHFYRYFWSDYPISLQQQRFYRYFWSDHPNLATTTAFLPLFLVKPSIPRHNNSIFVQCSDRNHYSDFTIPPSISSDWPVI